VIIADGSSEFHQIANFEIVQSCPLKNIEYRKFPNTLSLPDRLIDILENETSSYFIMGADDDYPLLEAFAGAADFLDNNPDYSVAVGSSFKLNLRSANHLTAKLEIPRHLPLAKPQYRCLHFSRWSFPTTYAIARREVLIERYRTLKAYFIPGFVDFTIGLIDCLQGKLAVLPDLSFIRTSHFAASHIRHRSGIGFLSDGPQIINLQADIQKRLAEIEEISSTSANSLANRIFRNRINELCGRRELLENVVKAAEFDASIPRVQAELFNDLFRTGTPARARYAERLQMIANNVYTALRSDDNLNEPQKVFSLGAQQSQKLSDQSALQRERVETRIQANIDARTEALIPKKDFVGSPNYNIKVDPETLEFIEGLGFGR